MDALRCELRPLIWQCSRGARHKSRGARHKSLLGAANFPFLFDPNSLGSAHQSPAPYWLLVVNAVLGLICIVTAVLAWRSGSRMLIRINAAALIINAITTLPGFFLNVTAGVKAISAVIVLATVVAVVLMLRRDRGPVPSPTKPPAPAPSPQRRPGPHEFPERYARRTARRQGRRR